MQFIEVLRSWAETTSDHAVTYIFYKSIRVIKYVIAPAMTLKTTLFVKIFK